MLKLNDILETASENQVIIVLDSFKFKVDEFQQPTNKFYVYRTTSLFDTIYCFVCEKKDILECFRNGC